MGAAAGVLLAIALSLLLFAVAVISVGALIGAVVVVVLYAGLKTVQGLNWAAKKKQLRVLKVLIGTLHQGLAIQ